MDAWASPAMTVPARQVLQRLSRIHHNNNRFQRAVVFFTPLIYTSVPSLEIQNKFRVTLDFHFIIFFKTVSVGASEKRLPLKFTSADSLGGSIC